MSDSGRSTNPAAGNAENRTSKHVKARCHGERYDEYDMFSESVTARMAAQVRGT